MSASTDPATGRHASVTDRLSGALQGRTARMQRVLGSPVRDTRMAVVLGRILGIAFALCFLTGLYSHVLQSPLPWLPLPTRPTWLYSWTQGIHVIAGTALVPLLLAKLWTVYPRLFRWPPVRGPLDALERASVALLVATALVEPVTGILNVLQWYPWSFSFRRTHFALAWVLMGALLCHIAVQLPSIRRYWRAGAADAPADEEASDAR
ncbi:cytochrome b/b6 domain-containing protein [Microbacterium bovistercoris]|uniref:cytochrome b/b6 domain-containing protein n=1 Tax=Microbacterium bovistercoris TaxID=2293570 RepID=UPI001FE4137B|nr:cytochrome b/b6 domain-containing protein [Microbacterium bovistercoris]